ncbi:MAG: hypothetical protein Q9165_003413, partial [Trypethelium subeluteriae]
MNQNDANLVLHIQFWRAGLPSANDEPSETDLNNARDWALWEMEYNAFEDSWATYQRAHGGARRWPTQNQINAATRVRDTYMPQKVVDVNITNEPIPNPEPWLPSGSWNAQGSGSGAGSSKRW